MGKAVIVSSLGEELYLVRLKFNNGPLDTELAALKKARDDYFKKILEAFATIDDLRKEKADAREGMDAVIDQWKADLISKINEEPPTIPPSTPNDPDTGNPWEDEDRSQDTPLFDAINAERTSAGVALLSRNDDLDQSILNHLRYLGLSGSTSHLGLLGSTAFNRALRAGYFADVAIGVGQNLAFGVRTPADAVAKWMRNINDKTLMLNPDYTQCGVAYVYRAKNPYTYLWGAVFAAPGVTIDVEDPTQDPAKKAAEDADAALDGIESPESDDLTPQKLAQACGVFAKAAQKLARAEEALVKIKVEHLERIQRIAELERMKAANETPVHAWACQFGTLLRVDDEVDTAEIPGFYSDGPVQRTTTMGVRNDPYDNIPDTVVAYTERKINLIPPIMQTTQLQDTDTMSPGMAFINCALEPGALRWKPIWRYAVITEKAGDIATIELIDASVRTSKLIDKKPMILDTPAQKTLQNVPISYPPCNGQVFLVGDEVLVLFEGYSRDSPKIIGFRREPRPCPTGRVSWK